MRLVYGILMGGYNIKETVEGDETYDEIMAALRDYYGGVTPTVVDIVKNLIKVDVLV